MAEPMRARATLADGIVELRVLMNHPMETGLRNDAAGKPVPAHFIREIAVRLNGRTVLDAQTSQALSRNPVFSFRLAGKAGDAIEIEWLDNRGERNRAQVTVS